MGTLNQKKLMRSAASILIALAMVLSAAVILTDDVSAASKRPGKAKVTSVTKLNQLITVHWNKTKKAKKYQIYAKAGKKKWKKVATVKANGKSKQTYNIKKCKWNTKYKIKVRAVNGKKKGKWSTIYQGKLDKKTTLQKFLKKHPSYQWELDQIANKNSNSIMDADITVSGNTMIMKMKYIDTDLSTDNDTRTQVQTALKKNFLSASMKKNMKKYVKDLELGYGIWELKMKVIVQDSVGTGLFSYTYK